MPDVNKSSRSSRDFKSLEEALNASVELNDAIHSQARAARGVAAETFGASESGLIWADAKDEIENNPFQPRFFVTPQELNELKVSVEQNGQLQAALARPHPRRRGHFQLADGARRRLAVLGGANAGSTRPDAHRFIDKLLIEVRPLTDAQMLDAAFEANEARQDFNVFDRARYYTQLSEMMSSSPDFDPGQSRNRAPLSWEELVELRKKQGRPLPHSAAMIRRLVEALTLPKNVQERLVAVNLGDDERARRAGEKHVRALALLSGHEQLALLREVEKEKISGNEALRRAQAARRGDAEEENITPPATSEYSQASSNAQTTSSGASSGSNARSDAPQNYEPPASITVSRINPSDALLGHLAQARLQSEIAAGAAQGARFGAKMRARVLAEAEAIQAATEKIIAAVQNDT